MTVIFLKCGQKAIIDDKDFIRVAPYRWCLSGNKHVMRYEDDKGIYLHHFLIGNPIKPLQTDHINRNPLDNRKSNLRHVPRSINSANRGLRADNTTGITGVYRQRNKWRAVNVQGIKKGGFSTKEQAAKWRNG